MIEKFKFENDWFEGTPFLFSKYSDLDMELLNFVLTKMIKKQNEIIGHLNERSEEAKTIFKIKMEQYGNKLALMVADMEDGQDWREVATKEVKGDYDKAISEPSGESVAQWEKEFDRRFTFIQSWTGGVGLSQGSSESPSLKQDIIGLKAFIKQQLEKLIEETNEMLIKTYWTPDISQDDLEKFQQQLRDKWL